MLSLVFRWCACSWAQSWNRNNDQYFSNVTLKANTKLGGVNHLASLLSIFVQIKWSYVDFQLDEQATRWLMKMKTMMVGIHLPLPTEIMVIHQPILCQQQLHITSPANATWASIAATEYLLPHPPHPLHSLCFLAGSHLSHCHWLWRHPPWWGLRWGHNVKNDCSHEHLSGQSDNKLVKWKEDRGRDETYILSSLLCQKHLWACLPTSQLPSKISSLHTRLTSPTKAKYVIL